MVKRCVDNWLEVAMSSTEPLSLIEFIDKVEFKIDKWTFDKFYFNLSNEKYIYLDESTIEWFGYEGLLLKTKKQQITNLLKKNFSNINVKEDDKQWFAYGKHAYKEFYKENNCENPILVQTPIENKQILTDETHEYKENNCENPAPLKGHRK